MVLFVTFSLKTLFTSYKVCNTHVIPVLFQITDPSGHL